MKPLSLFRDAVRAKEIVTTLARYGFDDLLAQLDTPPTWLKWLVTPKTEGLNTWQRIRKACEDLGPTYVKFAQLLSTRPDVLPQDFIEELKKLRDQVAPVPYEKIVPVIEKELGCEISEYFKDFPQDTVAAGSIGQIYKVRLKSDDAWVAVKVQRPEIENIIESDLEIIGWFAQQMHDRIDYLKPYDLPSVVEETKAGLKRELDFTNEARNAKLFNTLNPYQEKVFAPKVYDEFTTPNLLVTEWVTGQRPDRNIFLEEDRKDLATNGGNSVFHQIIISGFFHADPHGGNVLITPDKKVCFLDWGLAGQLTRVMRYFLADLLAAVAAQDPEKIVRVAIRMSRSNRRIDAFTMEKEITYLLRKYQDFVTSGQGIGNLIFEMLYVFGTNGIHVTQDYTLLAKAVISVEELGNSLDPDFDIRVLAKPYLDQLNWERWNPRSIFKHSYAMIAAGLLKIKELPDDLQRLIRRFEEEDLSINLHHKGLNSFGDWLSSAINRLVLAIIIGSLIIGSSLIITTGVEPHLWGYPVFGIAGYTISAMLGLWVMIDIIRHGHHK